MNNLRKLLYDAAMRLRGDEDGFVVGGGGGGGSGGGVSDDGGGRKDGHVPLTFAENVTLLQKPKLLEYTVDWWWSSGHRSLFLV